MGKESFQKEVYAVVAAIPVGKVMTYGHIADLTGHPQYSRRVGQALHHVPAELHLPSHRVVNAQGRLVPGWKAQRELLEKEGVRFKKNGCVDMQTFLWKFMEEL